MDAQGNVLIIDGGAPNALLLALTEGYRHRFRLADFRDEGLRLVGMLIQEDTYLPGRNR